jgi:DNA-binding transcriptional MocR family regulator
MYTVVLDWLEERLRSGEISVGDKLPGERHLAEEFGISRASVREAIRILDAMGLVRSSTGSGPNAGAIVIAEPSAALGWALRMHVANRSLRIGDLVETMLARLLEALREDRPEPGEEIRRLDDDVDALYSGVKLYLARMPREDLAEQESRRWAEIIELAVNVVADDNGCVPLPA